jgi:formylglycine-generating enzyme required for sulfatase activity
MGCSTGDSVCDADEKPAHEVEITRGFWIGQTEVTQAAYQKVVKTNSSHFKGPDRPVEQVTWDQSKEYCEAVGMRLPTEAEWEYAARAGSKGAQYGTLDQITWHSGNSNRHRFLVFEKARAWDKLY